MGCVHSRWGSLCKTAIAIDISDNNLGSMGAAAKALLASVLELHGGSTMTLLNISGCKLGVDGARSLAVALCNCK